VSDSTTCEEDEASGASLTGVVHEVPAQSAVMEYSKLLVGCITFVMPRDLNCIASSDSVD